MYMSQHDYRQPEANVMTWHMDSITELMYWLECIDV